MDRAADFLMPQLKTTQDAAKASWAPGSPPCACWTTPEAALKVLADTNSDKANDA